MRRIVPALLTAALVLATPALAEEASPPLLRDVAERMAADAPLPSRDASSAPPELGGDGRRTVGHFLPNLGRNVVGVFSKENLRPFLAAAAITGAASMFDDGTQTLLRDRAQGFGRAGADAGRLSTVGPFALGLFAAGRFAADTRMRATTYDIAQAFLVNGLYTTALKEAVARNRPDASDNKSFPSGHTSNAFAWATVANHHYGPRLGVPAYAVAGLIGLSRVEADKHHISDVVAGAALGVIIGKTVVREDDEPLREGKRLSLVPMTDAQGGGIGAGLQLSF